ncbi:hypothetical protein, partial [Streptomyces sp. NPDC046909]|uniref:hypothetical protein n=1 Tax=Streptomyces sp. NPDC046909 TaxID=3155617 RepID=UPI0033FB040E
PGPGRRPAGPPGVKDLVVVVLLLYVGARLAPRGRRAATTWRKTAVLRTPPPVDSVARWSGSLRDPDHGVRSAASVCGSEKAGGKRG